jgi:hypothetical protein
LMNNIPPLSHCEAQKIAQFLEKLQFYRPAASIIIWQLSVYRINIYNDIFGSG